MMNVEQERTTRHVSEQVFEALRRQDAHRLAKLYMPDATFTDSVLGELPRGAVADMWSTFLDHVDILDIAVADRIISVHLAEVRWRADYRILATGRRVALDLTTRLVCLGPRISRHEDRYDKWRWARMVHGFPGAVFGWSALWLQRQSHPGRPSSRAVTSRNATTSQGHRDRTEPT